MRPLAFFHTLQAENHIPGALKISFMPAPAQSAFTVLQAVELAFHFPSAVRTDLIALAHVISLHGFTDILYHTIMNISIKNGGRITPPPLMLLQYTVSHTNSAITSVSVTSFTASIGIP